MQRSTSCSPSLPGTVAGAACKICRARLHAAIVTLPRVCPSLEDTRGKNYGKLNARLRRSPATQPLGAAGIQLEHCWSLRLPDMLEGLVRSIWRVERPGDTL